MTKTDLEYLIKFAEEHNLSHESVEKVIERLKEYYNLSQTFSFSLFSVPSYYTRGQRMVKGNIKKEYENSNKKQSMGD